MKIKTAIVIPDMQVPFEDKKALRAVEKFMASRRWDYYVNLGDFMDMESLSKFSKGNAQSLAFSNVAADFRRGHEILKRHERIIRSKNKNAEMVLLEGNHEFRVERYCEEFPNLREILDVEHNLRLKELGIKWIRSWSKGLLYRIGNAYFTHGKYINKYHASKMADEYGCCIFYGHTHDVMSFPKLLYGKGKNIVGQSMGCLCRYDLKYTRGGQGTNWQHCFGVFFFMPNGDFTYNIVRIIHGQFVYEGKVYKG